MKGQYIIISIIVILYFKLNREETFDPEVQIKGKNVLVTGASSGIGEQLAYHYARMGANVFITARREQLLKKVIEKCRTLGRKDSLFGYVAADMEMYETTVPTVIKDAVKKMGGLDHIIINHAMLPLFRTWVGTEDDLRSFERIIEVNFVSYVHIVSHALPHLKKRQYGRIGVVSSLAGKLDVPLMASYSSSKFGLDGFFSAIRQELKLNNENVSVTLCNLGIISTDKGNQLLNDMAKTYSFDLDVLKKSPLAPTATPSDTALEIIKSTVQGDRELYYPPVMGSRYLTQMMPVIRHLFPNFLQVDPEYLK